jgi:O-antigen ligase
LLLRSNSATDSAHAILRGFLIATSGIALLAWIMPVQPDLRLGDPDYLNTNQIGNVCAFALFFAHYLERRIQEKWTIFKALLLLTVVRSLSKTTLAALLVSQAFLFVFDASIPRRKKVWLVIGTLALLSLFWGLFVAYFEVYTTTGNQSETFTGRTAIWAFALNSAIAKPWIGNGFDSLWKVMPPFGPDRFEARHAENELLQQFYAYGAVGVVALMCLYGATFRQLRRVRERPIRVVLLSLLLYVLVRGLAEAEPFDLMFPLWSIVLFSVLVHHQNDPLKRMPRALSISL